MNNEKVVGKQDLHPSAKEKNLSAFITFKSNEFVLLAVHSQADGEGEGLPWFSETHNYDNNNNNNNNHNNHNNNNNNNNTLYLYSAFQDTLHR